METPSKRTTGKTTAVSNPRQISRWRDESCNRTERNEAIFRAIGKAAAYRLKVAAPSIVADVDRATLAVKDFKLASPTGFAGPASANWIVQARIRSASAETIVDA